MQFLRFALLIVLALTGFGSGLCGIFGLGMTAIETAGGRGDSSYGVVVAVSLVGIAIAIGCFFAVRALARRMRRAAAPPPASSGTPPPPTA